MWYWKIWKNRKVSWKVYIYIYIPLVNIQQTMENHGTSPFLMSKSTINGPFSLWSSTRIRDEPQSRRSKEDAEDEVCWEDG